MAPSFRSKKLNSFIPSNLMRYVSGYDPGLLDDFRIVLKCLGDGFHPNQLNCIHAQAFHMNLILIPLDTALAMTDHYPTDKEVRAGSAFGPTREVQRDSNQPKNQHDP
jgi:hypothetical protein